MFFGIEFLSLSVARAALNSSSAGSNQKPLDFE